MELQVTNSPFNQEQVDALHRLLPTLTDAQKIWLSGYLTATSGVNARAEDEAQALASVSVQQTTVASTAPTVSKDVTVLYGSQTGNSQRLAEKLVEKLEGSGFNAKLSAMNDFKPNTLKKVDHLFIITSTHGEGDPPDNALSFYEFLYSKRAPKLADTPFSVLALGDTSYEKFCQTGKDFDQRLEELGGKRIVPRVDCDVDFEDDATAWIEQVVTALQAQVNQTGEVVIQRVGGDVASSQAPTATPEYSRSNPYYAEVLENLNLNGRGSANETRHIELSIENSGFQYEPGDCLGVYPNNHPRLVDELIQSMGWDADELVPINKNGDEDTLKEALSRHYEITMLSRSLIEKIVKMTNNQALSQLFQEKQALREYVKGRDLLDLAEDYQLSGIPARDFVKLLRKLPARLYSISSSPQAYPDEVHLTIRKVEYEAHGRHRYGVCSSFVSDHLQPGDKLPVFVQHNPHFKLPTDLDAPVIMIGPGTGVAPFRSFIGEREESGAKGKNWLFFGDQHFATDFLYQIEWQRWLKDGVLTRMDVAFSRDTEQKVYVQHRMLEHSKDLYAWLQEGAYIYVCGDKKKMASDVHAALCTILQQEGGMSEEDATNYLATLQKEHRYQRDVY